jgi:hypothetical protein
MMFFDGPAPSTEVKAIHVLLLGQLYNEPVLSSTVPGREMLKRPSSPHNTGLTLPVPQLDMPDASSNPLNS